MEAVIKALMEDRQKREQELMTQQAAEESRRNEERIARERREEAWRAERKEMQEHMQTMVEMMRTSGEMSSKAKPSAGLSVKLVPLAENDDIEAYLVTFERIMAAHKVEKNRWSQYLAPQLSGRAQLAFAALPATSASDYDAIKTAVLARYDINEESYRRRFRSMTRKAGETNREVAVRLMDVQQKWMKECTTIDEVQQLIGKEQFLISLGSAEQSLWVMEKKPETCVAAGELADEYEQARRSTRIDTGSVLDPGRRKPVQFPKTSISKCGFCGLKGHVEEECRKKVGTQKEGVGNEGKIRCYHCKKLGHISSRCPEKEALFCFEDRDFAGSKLCQKGSVEGRKVAKILLDTGCSRTMVNQKCVPSEKILDGKMVSIRCAHGDTRLYNLAEVTVQVQGVTMQVEAAVADNLPVDVLLGTDVPELTRLISDRKPKAGASLPKQEDVMVVLTRARARQQLEEEIVRRAKQVQSQVRPNPLTTASEADEVASQVLAEKAEGPRAETVSARILQDESGTPHLSSSSAEQVVISSGKKALVNPVPQMALSSKELKELQENDPTLSKVRRKVDQPNNPEGEFFRREGLFYRRWKPPGRGVEYEVEQLILPKQCRKTVLELAHDIPMAGHQGRDKTRQRILRRFYWPSVFQDIENFCKSCRICQKASKQRVKAAPLISLPVISEPFSRVAMDIVGPLPRSKAGHRYILVLCDYATRYPEAIALRSIDDEHIAEELMKLFSRVGVPKEILTDQGSNFTSQLLAELYRLLGVKGIRTSPYHPQTDGLVERFNQTLKGMLRKTVQEEGKDWDKMIPYLLFAYREVPQSSTGFSPFELLYGRDVRGPLDILRETWEASSKSDETVVSYVLETQRRLKEMADIAGENMLESQEEQKRWYDRRARLREFKRGDPVLVLLPTTADKLMAQWQGPYQVLAREGKVTYLVDMHDRKKRRRVFHVNMLKAFHVRTEAVGYMEEDILEGVDDIPVWKEEVATEAQFGEELSVEQLGQVKGVEQLGQVKEVLKEFRKQSIFSNRPGRTHLLQHRIKTGEARPVRMPQYRLPHAYRELVDKELQEMEEGGIIETSNSEWASPIVLIKKKDGTMRFCIDYRRLNAVTQVEAYPMPRIDDIIDRLGKAQFISTLDLTRGYWQMPVATEDRAKTAFVTPKGLYQFKMMPFGLNGAPASFQRLTDMLVKGCEEYAAAYLDDIVIFSQTWKEHLGHLKSILKRIGKANLTVKAAKCQFRMKQCVYLGHVVGNGMVQPEGSKVNAVKSFPQPETKHQVRGFLGLTGYYRRFIPDYAAIATPLTDLTRKSSPNVVVWDEKCAEGFERLKNYLCSSSVLRSPDFTKPFVLQTDASDRGAGAVLSQCDSKGEEHPVAYYSRKFLPREERYSTVEKECLAIKLAVTAFRVYLLGRKFTIQTDHRSLEWLDRLKDSNPRLCRWSLGLQPYQYTVVHRPGKANGNADSLSRIATNRSVAGEGRWSVEDRLPIQTCELVNAD